jgi:hypothetical protein
MILAAALLRERLPSGMRARRCADSKWPVSRTWRRQLREIHRSGEAQFIAPCALTNSLASREMALITGVKLWKKQQHKV